MATWCSYNQEASAFVGHLSCAAHPVIETRTLEGADMESSFIFAIRDKLIYLKCQCMVKILGFEVIAKGERGCESR